MFAYSGHPKAEKSLVSVLAFDGLLPSKQAELFIDINSKQKKVKRSLLEELYGALHWDSEKETIVARAIVSKAIQILDVDGTSPFYGRILKADEGKDFQKCISLTSVFAALDNPGFLIAKERGGVVVDYGPLWAGEKVRTLRRTTRILSAWFSAIRDHARDWWELGAAPGGGLAMNDGVTAAINVLRTVFDHLTGKGVRLVQLDDDELCSKVAPYAQAAGKYLASLSGEQRSEFRAAYGTPGQVARTRRIQQGIQREIPEFTPEGLEGYIKSEKEETTKRAKEIIDKIERTLFEVVIGGLRAKLGEEEQKWWYEGVPLGIRKKAGERREEEGGKLDIERYLDLIDYRDILSQNRVQFEDTLGYGKKSDAWKKRLLWIHEVNEIRKAVSHATKGVPVSLEQLEKLRHFAGRLETQITKAGTNSDGTPGAGTNADQGGGQDEESNS